MKPLSRAGTSLKIWFGAPRDPAQKIALRLYVRIRTVTSCTQDDPGKDLATLC